MRNALALAILVASAPALAADPSAPAAKAVAEKAAPGTKIQIKVTEDGFEPREITVRKGVPTTLVFTRVTERTCITAVDVPDEKVKKLQLPLNKPVELTITPQKVGVEAFHCTAMAMGDGKIVVQD